MSLISELCNVPTDASVADNSKDSLVTADALSTHPHSINASRPDESPQRQRSSSSGVDGSSKGRNSQQSTDKLDEPLLQVSEQAWISLHVLYPNPTTSLLLDVFPLACVHTPIASPPLRLNFGHSLLVSLNAPILIEPLRNLLIIYDNATSPRLCF